MKVKAQLINLSPMSFLIKWSVSFLVREHLISSQFFSKRNAFQIGFTPLPPPSIRKAYRTFSYNNRCRPSSRPRLSTTKLLRASLLSFSSREASADNIISTSFSFSPFPVPLHASSALRRLDRLGSGLRSISARLELIFRGLSSDRAGRLRSIRTSKVSSKSIFLFC